MCSAIFQAGSLLVLIAEVRTRAFLASLVPIIVNTVLNEHQLVMDIVAFVALGDFPRSRLGEKQRGKILASWVSRKMRTIAQFSIRDPDAEGSVGTVVPEHALARRGSGQGSLAGGGASVRKGASSLRHVESVTHMPVLHDVATPESEQFDPLSVQAQHQRRSLSLAKVAAQQDAVNAVTPTTDGHSLFHLNTTLEYSPVDQSYLRGSIYDEPPALNPHREEGDGHRGYDPRSYDPQGDDQRGYDPREYAPQFDDDGGGMHAAYLPPRDEWTTGSSNATDLPRHGYPEWPMASATMTGSSIGGHGAHNHEAHDSSSSSFHGHEIHPRPLQIANRSSMVRGSDDGEDDWTTEALKGLDLGTR